MTDFNSQIIKGFGMNLIHYDKAWDAYICTTDQGIKLVKETTMHTGRLMFIHSAKEHLYHQGFKHIDRFCMTSQDTLFYTYDGRKYIMMEWINGKYCDLGEINEIRKSVQALGELHKASKDMSPLRGSRIYSNLGKMPRLFEKRTRELKRIRNIVRKQSHYTEFDLMFIRNYPYYYQLAVDSMKLLEESNYYHLIRQAYEDKYFCHNDFTDHNILIGAQNEVFISGFDQCCYELPVYDLASFTERVLSKRGWKEKEALDIFSLYHEIKPITKEEIKIFISILMYPMKFWKICNREYNSSRAWRSKKPIEKMDIMMEEQEQHKKLIKELRTTLLH